MSAHLNEAGRAPEGTKAETKTKTKAERQALVLGGSGAVGAEVLRGLGRAGVATTFTYHNGRERAEALAAELGQHAVPLDLRDRGALRELIRGLARAPDVFIHCAALSKPVTLAAATDADWDDALSVSGGAAFAACQELAPRMTQGGDIVLLGALDRAQSLPMPVPFAASQGMLSALVMALSKELGPRGIRVNLLSLGVLSSGLSAQLSPKHLQEYQNFSALRRVGTPEEAARAALWLALDNSYMSGKVLSVNGGI